MSERPLTADEIEIFRKRAYNLENWGTFYLRGLIDQCGRDEEAGRELRRKLESTQ